MTFFSWISKTFLFNQSKNTFTCGTKRHTPRSQHSATTRIEFESTSILNELHWPQWKTENKRAKLILRLVVCVRVGALWPFNFDIVSVVFTNLSITLLWFCFCISRQIVWSVYIVRWYCDESTVVFSAVCNSECRQIHFKWKMWWQRERKNSK